MARASSEPGKDLVFDVGQRRQPGRGAARSRRRREIIIGEDVVRARNDARPFFEQFMAADVLGMTEFTRYGIDVLPLLDGMPRGQQGARFFSCLHHENAVGQPGNQSVANREVVRFRCGRGIR